jgi:hypothetical protein
MLEDVAKMLPPPVIQMIRTTLAQRYNAVDDEGRITPASSDGVVLFPEGGLSHGLPAAPEVECGDERVAHMLAWFEDHYRANEGTLPHDDACRSQTSMSRLS